MILIDHFIGPSKIDGLGVFAAEDAQCGQKIWEFNPLIDIVIPASALVNLPEHVHRRIRRSAEFYEGEQVYILGADGDAYMNHSCEPNLRSEGRFGFAARDIRAGEEITCDYRSTRVMDYNHFTFHEHTVASLDQLS